MHDTFNWLTHFALRCFHPGCDHERTWETEAALVAALDSEPWVDHSTGHAECSCHYPRNTRPPFPCDQALGRRLG